MIIPIMRGSEKRSFPLNLIPANVFYGWWLLILGSLILAVGSGVLYHGFTVFFLPLKRDLALSSASVSLLYGAARLEGGVEGPLIGYLIDRFGPRVVIIGGAAMAGIGLIILSMVNSFASFFFVYIFIVALGYNAGFFHPIYALVNSWFIHHRGFGFAAVAAASSIGGMIMAPFLSHLILNYGWRVGAVIGGVVIMGVAIPAAIPIYRSPEKIGLHPDGRPPQDQEKGAPANRLVCPDFSVREALHTLNYWLLFFAITLRILVTVALIIHFVPLLAWRGMSESAAAYLVSLFALCSIGTTLATGWLGDRWSKSLLCSLGVLPTVMAMSALILSRPGDALFAFPIGLALTAGTIPLNWALIGDLFGRRSYATLRGIMAVGYGIATFISPIYAGWIFDRTGSYQEALLTFIVAQMLGALLFGVLYLRSRGGARIGREEPV
jgi:sugar phosphate permease